MIAKQRILTVGGTVMCALGIGFLMQSNASTPPEHPVSLPAVAQQAVLPPLGASDVDDYAILPVEDITLTSASPIEQTPQRLPEPSLEQVETAPYPLQDAILPVTPSDPEMPQLGCAVSAESELAPMASVTLSVQAPCYGNQRVTVHHSGLMFTEVTDAQGNLSVTIPALSEKAVFVVAFTNGRGAVAMSEVEGLDQIDRVALQWSGNSGFQIHAREFGAGYGEEGHIWSDPSAEGQGQMVRLGVTDTLAPQITEIYSFNTGTAQASGAIALSIEAEVTPANCGRDILAQSIELSSGSVLRTQDLVLSMPDCEAAGDFLVLNNLFEDLKIAAK